uniref:ankyrin repeat domain-containing protein n=1 Tax=Altererythrobacter segetis TaxID=1104773 RepID=UPI001FAEBA3C|nr:ankyrin repeat domain-containing protein [Altererythrobacter segetis]
MALGHRIKLALAAIAATALLTAAPVTAQHYSDGFKFLQAVDKGDIETVKDLINKNSTVIDARDVSDGHTALHTATKRRDSVWLRYLLTLDANPNLPDKQGVTPLMLASQLGYVEGIAILASKGAKVDIANDAGETPLILAVHRRDIPMLRILLAGGADPTRTDNSGRSARDYAKLEGVGQALEEFDKSAKSKTKKSGQTYGPSF